MEPSGNATASEKRADREKRPHPIKRTASSDSLGMHESRLAEVLKSEGHPNDAVISQLNPDHSPPSNLKSKSVQFAKENNDSTPLPTMPYLKRHSSSASPSQVKDPLAISPGRESEKYPSQNNPKSHATPSETHLAPSYSDAAVKRPISVSPLGAISPALQLQRRNTAGGVTESISMPHRSSTPKRLNWSEMIFHTIHDSTSGRLVIQELFEEMCHKYPEVKEWASGADWEARVKNRIKSTLSIKNHLFVKMARPSRAGGKGSWWTLSAEALEAFREGRLSDAIRVGTLSHHSMKVGVQTASTSHDTSTTARGLRKIRQSSHDFIMSAPSTPSVSTFDQLTLSHVSPGQSTEVGSPQSLSENLQHQERGNISSSSGTKSSNMRCAPLSLSNSNMQNFFQDQAPAFSALPSPSTPASLYSQSIGMIPTPQSASFPLGISDMTTQNFLAGMPPPFKSGSNLGHDSAPTSTTMANSFYGLSSGVQLPDQAFTMGMQNVSAAGIAQPQGIPNLGEVFMPVTQSMLSPPLSQSNIGMGGSKPIRMEHSGSTGIQPHMSSQSFRSLYDSYGIPPENVNMLSPLSQTFDLSQSHSSSMNMSPQHRSLPNENPSLTSFMDPSYQHPYPAFPSFSMEPSTTCTTPPTAATGHKLDSGAAQPKMTSPGNTKPDGFNCSWTNMDL